VVEAEMIDWVIVLFALFGDVFKFFYNKKFKISYTGKK
jgi:hypothetical protein